MSRAVTSPHEPRESDRGSETYWTGRCRAVIRLSRANAQDAATSGMAGASARP